MGATRATICERGESGQRTEGGAAAVGGERTDRHGRRPGLLDFDDAREHVVVIIVVVPQVLLLRVCRWLDELTALDGRVLEVLDLFANRLVLEAANVLSSPVSRRIVVRGRDLLVLVGNGLEGRVRGAVVRDSVECAFLLGEAEDARRGRVESGGSAASGSCVMEHEVSKFG